MKLLLAALSVALLAGCGSAPRLDHDLIRPWSGALSREYPGDKPVIARYKSGEYEIFYLAARHTTTMGDETLRLVEDLFKSFNFNVLLIESIPYSSGESPKWFVEYARKDKSDTFIPGGESALGVILADERKIPFFAGEPKDREIYFGLKARGYTDEDIVGFYAVRQIPQWVRQKENKPDLLERKIPSFVEHYCRVFSVAKCPGYREVLAWYKTKMGRVLTADVLNEDTAPYSGTGILTQQISSDLGFIRDHFTLNIIENFLHKYKRVAVIYGAGHFLTLRNSFDKAFGEPAFTEGRKN